MLRFFSNFTGNTLEKISRTFPITGNYRKSPGSYFPAISHKITEKSRNVTENCKKKKTNKHENCKITGLSGIFKEYMFENL